MRSRVAATRAENAAAVLVRTDIADESSVAEPIVPYRDAEPAGPSSASISRSVESAEQPVEASRFELTLTINPVVIRILQLADLKTGWNTYGAGPVDETAQQRAIDLVFSLNPLTVKVSASVAPLANRGLALKWLTPDREIDVRFFPGGGDYCVVRRRDEQLVMEGTISSLETLTGIVEGHVLGRLPLTAS